MMQYKWAKKNILDITEEKKISERRKTAVRLAGYVEELMNEIRTLRHTHLAFVQRKNAENGEMRAERLQEENNYLRIELKETEKKLDRAEDDIDAIKRVFMNGVRGGAEKAWFEDKDETIEN